METEESRARHERSRIPLQSRDTRACTRASSRSETPPLILGRINGQRREIPKRLTRVLASGFENKRDRKAASVREASLRGAAETRGRSCSAPKVTNKSLLSFTCRPALPRGAAISRRVSLISLQRSDSRSAGIKSLDPRAQTNTRLFIVGERSFPGREICGIAAAVKQTGLTTL